MARRVTKLVVDGISARGRDVIVWDGELKGFGIRCRQSGAKYYVVKLRAGGRQRWLTIGRHGSPWTPKSARNEALRLLGLKANGRDPASERDRQHGVMVMSELGERFLDKHVARRCKPTTAVDYRYAIRTLINPLLGRHRITDVTRADIARLHGELEDRPSQANRALAILSKMFNLAEEWGLRNQGTNPCRHVRKYKEAKRERYLTREEFQRLGTSLAESAARQTESPFVIGAVMLLIFTGARLGEILTLEWRYLDFESRVLRLPDSKTGAKLIHLNEAALDVLRRMPRIEGNPFVIAGDKLGAHLVNLQKPWRRIRHRAGLDDLRIHDLRHSFASVAAGVGLSLPLIGNLLGHSQPATTARYAHLAVDPVRAAAELIGNEIAATLQPKRSH